MKSFLGAALLIAAATLAASAQQPQPPQQEREAQERMADPKACAPGERLPEAGTSGQAPDTGENLSDKLARTDGVLCPPKMDSDIQFPTPPAGRTPVIPPPGSPGGDPSVQPK